MQRHALCFQKTKQRLDALGFAEQRAVQNRLSSLLYGYRLQQRLANWL